MRAHLSLLPRFWGPLSLHFIALENVKHDHACEHAKLFRNEARLKKKIHQDIMTPVHLSGPLL